MKLSRKIIISVMATTFALLAFTSTTFAWFEIAQANAVNDLTLTVNGDNGFEISLDNINYYEALPTDLIQNVIGQIDLKDITSFDGINFTNGYLSSSATAIPNKDYISFDLYFRSNIKRNNSVYLIDNVTNTYNYTVAEERAIDGTFFYSKGIEWRTDYDYNNGDRIITNNERNTFYAKDALRIAFVEQLFDEEDKRTELRSFIFDPTENEYRGYGKEYGALDYFKKKNFSNIQIPSTIPNTIYNLSKFYNPYEAKDDNSNVATLIQRGDTYKYAKVTVNIWLEGWDADCLDAILRDSIIMQLKFRSATTTSK